MPPLNILSRQIDLSTSASNILIQDQIIFTKFMHAFNAIYMYEWLISLDFEWEFISGKKTFRWPMIFYFANRYTLFFSLIGFTIALDATTIEIDCQALYIFNQLTGNGSVGLASINLCIRTMIIWSYNKYIVGVLMLLILGHWSLILQGSLVSALWVEGTGCILVSTNNTVLLATLIYAMCLDLIVMVLTAYKLLDARSINPSIGESKIANLIFKDGLIFFFIAFLANSLALVFIAININPVLSIIFNAPAAIMSTIVACRAVRRLKNFTQPDPKVSIVPSAQTQGIAFHDKQGIFNFQSTLDFQNIGTQAESFTRADVEEQEISEPRRGQMKLNKESDLEVVARGNPLDHRSE